MRTANVRTMPKFHCSRCGELAAENIPLVETNNEAVKCPKCGLDHNLNYEPKTGGILITYVVKA